MSRSSEVDISDDQYNLIVSTLYKPLLQIQAVSDESLLMTTVAVAI